MRAYLTMTKGTQVGTSFSLSGVGENVIGRDPSAQVALDDLVCSRRHAVIGHDGGAWYVQDTGSRNGTYVNGERIHGTDRKSVV